MTLPCTSSRKRGQDLSNHTWMSSIHLSRPEKNAFPSKYRISSNNSRSRLFQILLSGSQITWAFFSSLINFQILNRHWSILLDLIVFQLDREGINGREGGERGDFSRDGYYSRKYGNITILVVSMGTFPSKWSLLNAQQTEKTEKKRERRGEVLSKKLVERAEQLYLFWNCLLRMLQLFFGIWNKGTGKRFAQF